ncbi:nucleoside diphosphate-linked moiety X motif 8 isoform X2 [Corythoichthys intestinalis]|uniref:nucleoside diphosphate-linked moiety X motif 8 isoform X2 n=1 Tax=Corythoichthys intestinalis TaxID=161448 RepID=UPI0025A5DB1F|nr:nucleoside diphosphate-linked moiety X motif 8 isoform X2 [Corythoichthys intestinalis]
MTIMIVRRAISIDGSRLAGKLNVVNQCSRMFRSSQLGIVSCPLRSLLRLNESYYTRAQWHINENRNDCVNEKLKCSSPSTETALCLTKHNIFTSQCDNELMKVVPSENLNSKPLAQSPWMDPKTVKTQECLSNATRHPPQRYGHFCHLSHSLKNKTYCHSSCYRQKFVSSLNVHTRAQAYSLFSHQARTVHGAWSECLTLENENRCRRELAPNLKMYDVERGRKAQSQDKNKGRWASILVSLCSVKEQPAFLFTLRSSMLKGRHKGDVSFAGGKSDPSDNDVVATALREAREELGVNVSTESVWGVLKPLRDMVEEIFSLSLSHLCDPLNRGYTHFRIGDRYGYTLPVFRNGKYPVWGLTAVALDHTLKLLTPSHLE